MSESKPPRGYASSEEIFSDYGCKNWGDMYRLMARGDVLSEEDGYLMSCRSINGEQAGALLLAADRLGDISKQLEFICEQVRNRV